MQHQKALKTQVTQIGIILKHNYSEATLSTDQLKGKDYNLYTILISAFSLKIRLIPISVAVQGRRTEEYQAISKNEFRKTLTL